MSAHVFIQGATGNIGSAAASYLIKHRASFASLKLGARNPNDTRLANLKEAGAEVVTFDTAKPETMVAALKGVDVLIAVPPGATPSPDDREAFGRALVPAAKEAGVKHIVLFSVLGCEYKSILFARQFRAIEELVEQSGIPYTFLRSGMFVDNFYGWAAGIQGGAFYNVPSPDKKFAPALVADLGEAMAKVALNADKHKNKAYPITGPQSLSGQQIADIFAKETGQQVKYVQVPEAASIEALKSSGFPEWQAKGMQELWGLVEKGITDAVTPDLAALCEHPTTTVEQFVRQNVEAFRKK